MQKNKNKIIWYFQLAFGAFVAILIANLLQLQYPAAAGITTLLMQETRKATLQTAVERIGGFFLMYLLIYLIFPNVGYTPLGFGLFIGIFTLLSNALNVDAGIVTNAVFATHFLAEGHVEFGFAINEFINLLIGTGIGITLSFLLPKSQATFQTARTAVQEKMDALLDSMVLRLQGLCPGPDGPENCGMESFEKSNEELEDLLFELKVNLKEFELQLETEKSNRFFDDPEEESRYFQTRRIQTDILEHMVPVIKNFSTGFTPGYLIADFLYQVKESLCRPQMLNDLMDHKDKLYEYFRQEKLPTTRREFEERAQLFVILNDIAYFVDAEKAFQEE